MTPVGVLDRLVVAITGRMRIRVFEGGDAPRGEVYGKLPGPPSPARALREVLALKPPAPGVVDVSRNPRGGLRVRASSGLGAAFEQRLRNALGNL